MSALCCPRVRLGTGWFSALKEALRRVFFSAEEPAPPLQPSRAKVNDQAVALLEAHKSSLAFDHIDVDKSVVKVSIVGAGMVDNAGVAAKMFGALYDADINIHMISTSEIKVSVLLDEADANMAVQAIHDKFFGE